ncbi:S8 family serine peptidase [Dactylosporangium sp. NPDC048998]|uniref:S8 family peptidase n=1 Tax=Dactylosporangium sp. NPDC048998 TaxID=3363976 RepID=UPI003711A18B
MARPLHDPQQRFWEQVEGIRDGFGATAVGPPGTEEDPSATPRYLMEPGHVLVRAHDLPHVRSLAAVRSDAEPRVVHGIARVPVDGDAPAFARQTPMAHPNHLVTITPVNSCPADEPTLPPPAGPRARSLLTPPRHPDEHAGQGVDVLVVDTGLVPDFLHHETLADVTGFPNQPVPPNVVTQYYGHGTFIAGVLKNTAPGVSLHVSNELMRAGTISEFELGEKLLAALPEHDAWPHIISLSAGAPTESDDPLMGLEEFIRRLVEDHPETVLVAAAGNDGEPSQPFWPAALAPRYAESRAIVAVGALREDGEGRACFSNYGDWVSVYAPGERLVNTFATGTYQNVHGNTRDCRYYPGYDPLYRDCTCVTAGAQGATVQFHGLARWSGTSFATPIVAGRIARCMDLDGRKRTSREAAQYLLTRRVRTIRDRADGLPLPVLFEEDSAPA